MKNNLIKAAAVTPELKIGDIEYNMEQIMEVIDKHSDSGLIVFPELSLTGYTCADLFQSDLLLNEAQAALVRIAAYTKDMRLTVVVGLPVRFENCIYNCGAVISGGRVKAVIPKSYLPNYSEFYECRWFSPGKGITGRVIRIGDEEILFGTDILAEDPVTGTVLGVEICEDLWVPDKPSTHAALAGANIIANLSASDELIGKQEYRRELIKQQSGSCYCAYIYCSSGTHESSTDLVFSGHTLIAQNGSVIGESIFPGHTHVEEVLIDLSCIMHDRRHQNTYENDFAPNYRRVVGKYAGGRKE